MKTRLLPRSAPAEYVARETKRLGLPGQASRATIRRKRQQRATRNDGAVAGDARARLHRKLLAEATSEIAQRGGETVIAEQHRDVELSVADRDPKARIVLVSAHGWRQYSRQFGARRASVAYLYGRDDAGPWAVRVPGTTASAAEALSWLEPTDVTRARRAGKRVRRQGDVYAIETSAAHDGKGAAHLPQHHRWNATTRYLTHHPERGGKHRPVKLSFPVRFVPQRAYEMGRSGGRGNGD